MDPELLKNIYLFEDLSQEEITKVSEIVASETFPEGHMLFNEGDKGDRFYIIRKGAVRISQNISGTGEEALTILEEGTYFGEMALIDDAPRSADAIIHTETELFVISKKDFDNLTYGETISLDIIQKEFGEQVQKAFGKMLCVFLRKKIDGKLEPHLPEHLDRLEMFRTKVMISDVYQLFVFFSSGKNTSTSPTKDSLEVVEIKNETDTKA